MPNNLILVVDDEVMLVDLLKIRLEASGYEVAAAHDGYDGLTKAEQLRPQLIILDINMDKMDGYTMLKHLRTNARTKDIKVIMLTASGKNRDLFEKEGISDYVTKPFDADDFVKRVNRVIDSDFTPPATPDLGEKKPKKAKMAKKAGKAKQASRSGIQKKAKK